MFKNETNSVVTTGFVPLGHDSSVESRFDNSNTARGKEVNWLFI